MFTVLVTGSSRGIGYAVAKEFLSQGFNVVINGKNPENLLRAKATLSSLASENQVFAIEADVSTRSGVTSLVEQFNSLNLSLDVVVNNAGLFLPGTMIDESEDQFETLWKVNLSSAYWLTKDLWETLRKSNRAHVINMCSIASITAYDAGGTYSLVKHALLGFTKSLRKEGIPYGIRVTAIMPGATHTDSWAGVDLPQERFMDPQSVANVCYTAFAINRDTVMEEVILRPILGDI